MLDDRDCGIEVYHEWEEGINDSDIYRTPGCPTLDELQEPNILIDARECR